MHEASPHTLHKNVILPSLGELRRLWTWQGAVRALRARAQQASAGVAASQAELLSLKWRLEDALQVNQVLQELRRKLMYRRAEARAAGTGNGGGAGEGASAGSPSMRRVQLRPSPSRAQLARLRERLRKNLSREAARHQVSG